MKQWLTLIILTVCISITNAQKGGILNAGASLNSFSSDEFLSENLSTTNVFLSYEWVPAKSIGFGLELQKSIVSNNAEYFDIRLKIGGIINGKHRLQFPVYGSINFYNLKDLDADIKYGKYGYGIKAGIRFYITDHLSLNGGAEYSYLPTTKIGDDEFDEAQGSFNQQGFYVGLGYHFSSKK